MPGAHPAPSRPPSLAAPPGCSFPGTQMLQVLTVAERLGACADAVLEGTGLTVAGLELPGARVGLADAIVLVRRARALSSDPALGVHLGLAYRAAHYGYLGFATMSAPTLRAALELAVRLSPTVTTAFSLDLVTEPPLAALVVREHVDFEDVRDVFVLSLTLGIVQVGRSMTGRAMDPLVELAIPEPDYAPRLAESVSRYRFGCSANRIVFDTPSLDFEYAQSDPVALRMLVAECERELPPPSAVGLASRVRGILREGSFPTLEEVARTLGLSTRTLKRRLADEGLTFRALLDDARHERALVLLRTDLALAEIGGRLGYSNVANFERAFRRWTGETPAAFRQRWAR